MRRAVAAVRRKRRGDLRNLQVEERRLDHHFRRKLHPGRLQFQPVDRSPCENLAGRIENPDWAAKEHPPKPAKTGFPK